MPGVAPATAPAAKAITTHPLATYTTIAIAGTISDCHLHTKPELETEV